MLKSMTGYGRGAVSVSGCNFTVEIRGVNHRYLDCAVRVPRLFVFLEDTVKTCVSNRLARGKVDVYINVDTSGAKQIQVSLNRPVVSAYIDALRELQTEFSLAGEPTVAMLARMPDVFTVENQKLDNEAVAQAVLEMMGEALDDMEAMRIREGQRLCESIIGQFEVIEELVVQIQARTVEILPEYHAKLEARIRETMGAIPVEEPRLLTEVAIFADKIANNEEVVRLRSHLTELNTLLHKDGAQGRKVDFLVQELQREANTIGSKGNDAPLARLVVMLKAEIEKIREQIQNLE